MSIPQSAKNHELWERRLLVVDEYKHVKAGENKDNSAPLQEAIDDAYEIGYMPIALGKWYGMANTLWLSRHHFANGLQPGSDKPKMGPNPYTKKGFTFRGSYRTGQPVLKLLDSAPDADPDNPRPLFAFRLFESEEYDKKKYKGNGNPPANMPPPSNWMGAPDGYFCDSSWAFLYHFENFAIDVSGHRGWIGMTAPGAQGGILRDITILADGAKAAFAGVPGRNWMSTRCIAKGGDIGLLTGKEAGAGGAGELIVGWKFEGQRVAAIQHEGLAPITVVGCDFYKRDGNFFETQKRAGTAFNTLTFVDCKFQADNADRLFDNSKHGKNVFFKGCYARGIERLNDRLPLRSGWSRFDYSYCDQSKSRGAEVHQTFRVEGDDKHRQAEKAKIDKEAPPVNLCDRHIIPVFDPEDPDVILTSDESDLEIAIAKAEKAGHNKVYLNADVRVTEETKLRKHTKIYGPSHCYTSKIVTPPNKFEGSAIFVSHPDADATCALQYLSVELGDNLYKNPVSFFEWRGGGSTHALRYRPDFETNPDDSEIPPISMVFEENANGQHGPTSADDHIEWTKIFDGGQDEDARTVLFDETELPLHFYGMNIEKGKNDGRHYDCEFDHCSNIRIYSSKREADYGVYFIDGCDNIGIYTLGALREEPHKNHPHIHVIDSKNIQVANALVQTQKRSHDGVDLLRVEKDGKIVVNVQYPNGIVDYRDGKLDDAIMWPQDAVAAPQKEKQTKPSPGKGGNGGKKGKGSKPGTSNKKWDKVFDSLDVKNRNRFRWQSGNDSDVTKKDGIIILKRRYGDAYAANKPRTEGIPVIKGLKWGDRVRYSYDVWLDPNADNIVDLVNQWHDRPDRRNGKKEFSRNPMIGLSLLEDRAFVKQFLDHSGQAFSDRATYSTHKEELVLWEGKLPRGEFIHLDWEILWSRKKDDWDGFLSLHCNGQQLFRKVQDYNAFNDAAFPYGKFGTYRFQALRNVPRHKLRVFKYSGIKIYRLAA